MWHVRVELTSTPSVQRKQHETPFLGTLNKQKAKEPCLVSPANTHSLPRPTPQSCCVILRSHSCVSNESVCTHRPLRDFKDQRWLQGWKLSIPLTSLDRPGGWQIKSLKPKTAKSLPPGLCLSSLSLINMFQPCHKGSLIIWILR